MTTRQTHTYVELEVSAAAYDEIAAKLKAAGYAHAFMSGEDVNGRVTIDMHGIGITRAPAPADVSVLFLAWADAVRQQWLACVDANPELKAQHAVAQVLMRQDGNDMVPEPICGMPGIKPVVAIVDGKEAVCYDSMWQAMPLSVIYVEKVRNVQSAAAGVAKMNRFQDEAK